MKSGEPPFFKIVFLNCYCQIENIWYDNSSFKEEGKKMRNLVSIREITALIPIADADFIELAEVNHGWKCVVKKGEFAVGDLAVYHEIDSFVPASNPAYGFLERDFREYDGNLGARLRTMKLRGVLSQGLALPLKSFDNLNAALGDDVTDIIGVKKWEPSMPAQMAGEARGLFPSYIPKTDQERCQGLPQLLVEQGNFPFEATIKIDGASATIFYGGMDSDVHFGCCSRNYEMKDTPTNTIWAIARKFRLDEVLPKLEKHYAFQGEIFGEGLQGNPEKIKGQSFLVFDVYNITDGRYLNPPERAEIIDHINQKYGCGIEMVPVLETFILNEKFSSLDDILAYAEGSSWNPSVKREGVVFKRMDGKFSFKAISNQYLLKHPER